MTAGVRLRVWGDFALFSRPEFKAERVTYDVVVPQPPKRTVGIAAGFLCDNAGYLLGHDAKNNASRAADQFAAARHLHETVLGNVDNSTAATILTFFRSWDPSKAAVVLSDQEMATGWLVLRDAQSGRYFHEMPPIRAAWERHWAMIDAPHGQCLITGRGNEPISLVHPAIKGIPGAQTAGAALVSFNCDAFTSYGKAQNLNAPVGIGAAFAYTTALNHLLRPDSRRKLRIGDTSIVVWAERATPAEQIIPSVLGAISDNEDVMTPSAARGILECIHWKPAIRWSIDRIYVLKPIRLDTVRRNEVGGKLPYGTARQAARGGETEFAIFVDEERQQRASLLLRNVDYVIDAHFELTPNAGPDDNPGKHADMAGRRIARGQCVQQPCFGCREFPAFFEPVEPDAHLDPPEELRGTRSLGWMLHDIDFADNAPRRTSFVQSLSTEFSPCRDCPSANAALGHENDLNRP
jgi:CRISPR-associated protein Cas5d